MEYLNKIKDTLKIIIKNFWFILVFTLLIIIYFKNNKITNLQTKLLVKPEIELVYNVHTDTIKGDSIPYPINIIKYKDNILVYTDSVPIELTKADSTSIALSYITLYTDYNTIKEYDDVLKDDSLAFIQIKEKVTKNTIFNRELVYTHKTPTVTIHTIKQDKLTSIVGGIDASIGKTYNSFSVGVGLVTPKNSVYLFRYDPINKAYGGSVNIPIFNFKK